MKNIFNKIKYIINGNNPRVLAIVNHYYGEGNGFVGKSTTQSSIIRRNIVRKVIKNLKKIPNIEIIICGIKGKTLIDLDKDFSYLVNPSFLVYESIEWMTSQVNKYDYFINIEDDVLLTRETFNKVLEFDISNNINECFHPNRMENKNHIEYCVDLKALPGWTDISKKYKNYELRVADNPHSGISILSKPKLLYAIKLNDFKRRDIIIGYYMASAYANLHTPFLLFRSFSDLSAHQVLHLDNWVSPIN